MQTSTEHVRLRVLVENVTSSDVAIPKGDYDGNIDWKHPDDTEPRMASVRYQTRQSATLSRTHRESKLAMRHATATASCHCAVASA